MINTLARPIDAEIGKLQNMLLCSVQLEETFVFTFVPKTTNSSLIFAEENGKYVGVKLEDDIYRFEGNQSINNDPQHKERCLLLPIHFLLAGDLKFLMMCQGRETFSPHACAFCLAKRNEWKINKYQGTCVTPYDYTIPAYGFNSNPFLFQNIMIYALAPLHIKLGMGQQFVTDIFEVTSKYGVENEAIIQLLSINGVDKKNYRGGCLIGRHIDNLLDKTIDILSEIQTIVFQKLWVNSDVQISREFIELKEMMLAFKMVSYFMSRCQKLTSEETLKFTNSIERFCSLYRLYHGTDNITPKFHVIECHFQAFVEMYGTIGLYSEESLEKLHAEKNQQLKVFSSIRNKERQNELIFSRYNDSQIPEVTNIWNIFEQNTRKGKRKFQSHGEPVNLLYEYFFPDTDTDIDIDNDADLQSTSDIHDETINDTSVERVF